MKTIIITGGAGFIGSNFIYYLLTKTKGNRLVVYDKLTYAGNLDSLRPAFQDRRVRFIKGDIANPGEVENLFRSFRPELVFNFAAESHVDRSIDGPAGFVQTNLVGTFRMLDGARRHWTGLKGKAKKAFRFLHVSTDEVYGSLGQKGSFSENTPYAPNSPYAATKAGADHLVRAYHETYGLPVLLTHCSNNYGPYQYPEKLIPLMILNAAEGKPLPVYGDGGNIRDWLYVEDHCEALWKVMVGGKTGEKYNVGGNSEKTNLQVVDMICRNMEKVLPAGKNRSLLEQKKTSYKDLAIFVKDRPGHDRRYAINASKIRRELGWSPRHSFERAMEKTIRWYLENPQWCETVQSGKYRRGRLGLSKGEK